MYKLLNISCNQGVQLDKLSPVSSLWRLENPQNAAVSQVFVTLGRTCARASARRLFEYHELAEQVAPDALAHHGEELDADGTPAQGAGQDAEHELEEHEVPHV